jgi:adenosylhomocysteine nucleosidase
MKVGGSVDGGPAGPSAPAPGPVDIGIVAALPIEVGHLLDRLARPRTIRGPKHRVIEGELGSKLVALIISGPGCAAARRAAHLLIDGHRPRWLLSVGFAGALDLSLPRNAVLLATEVRDEAGARWSIDVTIPGDEPSPLFRAGTLLTVSHIVRTAEEKALLRARFGADAVDMETAAVAEACAERQVRMLSIRVVSDEARLDLPPEILSILGRSGGYRLGAALGAVWRRPSSVKDLWNLRLHALEAADSLAEVVAGAIQRLT